MKSRNQRQNTIDTFVNEKNDKVFFYIIYLCKKNAMYHEKNIHGSDHISTIQECVNTAYTVN